mmetsp:Transcript_6884/g.30282  ORF Transcript_6884/g.30282 Transcript_6884/m.30282 type:complete len:212 (-) Transcript_6884:925-1560(-)
MRQSRRPGGRRRRRTRWIKSRGTRGVGGFAILPGDEPPEPRAHARPSPVPVRGGPARGAVGRVPEHDGEEVPRRRLDAKLLLRRRRIRSRSFYRREVRGTQARELKARAPEPERGAVRAVRRGVVVVVGHQSVGYQIVGRTGSVRRISSRRARPPRRDRAIAAAGGPRADGVRERNLQRAAQGVDVVAPRGGREPLEDDGRVGRVRRALRD